MEAIWVLTTDPMLQATLATTILVSEVDMEEENIRTNQGLLQWVFTAIMKP